MPAKKTCFMIQPFSEPYDTRYNDTYKLAIEAADLVADRVDKDLAVDKIVPAIHKKIEKAAICLAEISTDRPNVWYEIAYAIAHGKPMVYVCDKPRKTKMPFDFDRRQYIPLKGQTKTAFAEHEKKIIDSIKAKMQEPAPQTDVRLDNITRDLLNEDEIIMLCAVLSAVNSDSDCVILDDLKKQLDCVIVDGKFQLTLLTLKQKKIVQEIEIPGNNFNDYQVSALTLTQLGAKWCADNAEYMKIELEKHANKLKRNESNLDDIPF